MGRELVPGCEQEDINLIFVPISNLTSDRQENTAAGWTHRTHDPGWTMHCDLKPAFGPRAPKWSLYLGCF